MRSLNIGAKNVYWSTTKVASHIRSGHCKGATDEEVQNFKVGNFSWIIHTKGLDKIVIC